MARGAAPGWGSNAWRAAILFKLAAWTLSHEQRPMSDEPSANEPAPKPARKRELSMEQRLLLAFALMGIVLFATPYLFKSPTPPAPQKKATTAAQGQTTAPASGTPAPPAAAPAKADSTGKGKGQRGAAQKIAAEKIVADQEQTYTVETDLYKVVFSNRGAVVQQWILKKNTDYNGNPLALVNEAGVAKDGYPFTLVFDQKKPAVDVNAALFAAKPADDGLGITYEYSEGALTARKAFHFEKSRYITQISTEVTENGAPISHLIAWRGGFGDPSIANPLAQHSIYFDLTENKLITHDVKAAKNGPVASEGNFSFAGIEDTYFTAAFLPVAGPVKLVTFSDTVPTATNPKEEPHVGIGIGNSHNNF